MLCITEKICKEILKCYDTNLCKMGSFDHIVAELGISHLKGNIEVVIFLNLYMKVRNSYLNRIIII